MPADDTDGAGRPRRHLADYLLDFSRRAYWPRRVVSLLRQALSERVSGIR